MLSKRIIPCLDIKDGRTVKGVNFLGLRDAGDPVELAATYASQGADELVFLDITATNEKRKTLVDLVRNVARQVNIPFTVGGGIASPDDVYALLHAGADKISINSAAVKAPNLIAELSKQFGSQCVVVAIDAKNTEQGWRVHLNGGRIPTELDLFAWGKQAEDLGAGELLFTSMDNDGVKQGFALAATQQLCQTVNVPVIASGGAGTMQHFADVFKQANADAALAASIFHYKEIAIPELKQYLHECQISIRL